MTHNPTEQQHRLMAALSAAEQATAASPSVPEDLLVLGPLSDGGPYTIDVRFRCSRPQDVREFATALGLVLALDEKHRGQDRPYLEARGAAFGVEVHAWALGSAEDLEAYRSASGPVALPSAWRKAAAA